MDFIESLMKEIVEEVSKGIPEDVLEDLKELSMLQADVRRCMVRNQIIDHRTITRINELTKKHFHAAEENVKANEKQHETFDFGEAIRRMKKGGCVSRRRWGYGTYIQIACDINYTTLKNTTNTHNPAIVFVGYRGAEMGWMPRNADMMAEDWYELKED